MFSFVAFADGRRFARRDDCVKKRIGCFAVQKRQTTVGTEWNESANSMQGSKSDGIAIGNGKPEGASRKAKRDYNIVEETNSGTATLLY